MDEGDHLGDGVTVHLEADADGVQAGPRQSEGHPGAGGGLGGHLQLPPAVDLEHRLVAGEPYERIIDYELGELPEPLPARSSAYVQLKNPDMLVEMECIAVVPDGQ